MYMYMYIYIYIYILRIHVQPRRTSIICTPNPIPIIEDTGLFKRERRNPKRTT